MLNGISTIARGLEQGFTLSEHPTANTADLIHVDLAVSGTLTGEMIEEGVIQFANNDDQTVLTYDHLFAFDNNAKPLPATMSLNTADDGTQTVRLSVDTATAQFPIVIDPLASAADWYAETDQADNLGFSVSSAGDVNGDGFDDVVIGANWYDNGNVNNAGAAFVYLGSAGGLSSNFVWAGMGSSSNDEFGYAVSEAGDVNGDGYADIIIGTFGADSAYIYYGNGDGIDDGTDQTLTEQDGSKFGTTVSFAGDVNQDGFADVIVGAPSYLSGQGSVRGRAFVYYGSDSGVGSTADWIAEAGNDNTFFGISVSNAGDVNGDQVDDIIIGDSYGNNNLEDVGTVYIYLGAVSEGLQNGPIASEFDADWTADDPDFDDLSEFGFAVSTAGDVNADNIDDIIVGAPKAVVGNDRAGSAYVYLGPLDSQNTSGLRFDFDGSQLDILYGYSVSTAGDIDGDGDSEIIIGAPNYDTASARPSGPNGSGGGAKAGTAEIFAGEPDASEGLSFLTFIDGDLADGLLGASVDTAGDVNGDGYKDVIVGAPTYVGSNGSSRAFVFHGTGAITSLTAANDGPTELGDSTLLTAVHASPNSGFNSYSWDFGDGTFGSGQVTTHIYSVPGVYSATVSVSNDFSGMTETAVTIVTIQDELYVDPTNGGSTTFDDGSGNTTQVDVPPGAVNEPISIEFVPLDPSTFTSNRGINSVNGGTQPLPANNTTIFFDLNAGQPKQTFLPLVIRNSSIGVATTSQTGQTNAMDVAGGTCDPDHYCFDEPVVLVLGYDEANLNGEDESSLILVVWDENTSQWVDATTTCKVPSDYTYDPDNNTFSLEICHISRFGVVGAN